MPLENSALFTLFIIVSILTSSIPSGRLLTRFDNELAINLTLSIHCNM